LVGKGKKTKQSLTILEATIKINLGLQEVDLENEVKYDAVEKI